MWPFLSLVAVTTFVLLLIFLGLVYLKAPVYRLTKSNFIRLFELVLAGEANESDWDVFLEVPIRYDDELEGIRLKCVELTEREAVYVDAHKRLCVSEEGRRSLEEFRSKLSSVTEV